VEQTVRAYTLGGAVAAGLEARSGTLAPGKWTDLTVLSRDVFAEPAEALLDTKVTYTVVDGEVVYSVSAEG
jgi:predicted amidohydrolase YtcJ